MMNIHQIREIAIAMLEELEGNYLEVIKIRKSDGTWARIAVSKNAEWYSAFCKKYLSTRRKYPRPRTFIKRNDTIKALRKIIRGETDGIYIDRLLNFIHENL